jgi:uncharacterized oligopeptide transporter (OPT) family protein
MCRCDSVTRKMALKMTIHILPFFNPLSMLLGAVAAWLWARRKQTHAERYVVPVSSGVIAGESIVSVAIALVNNLILRR